MPTPDWAHADYDPFERPHIGAEVIGRGAGSRRSKTYIQSVELAARLSHVQAYIPVLINRFRRLHAVHYKVKITVTEKNGAQRVEERPHFLTDDEVRDLYPVVKEWDQEHADLVEHFASIKGFSVNRATGFQEDRPRGEKREETSAGTDKQTERWR